MANQSVRTIWIILQYIVWKRWRFHELMWNFLFDKATCVTIWYDSWYAFDLCFTRGKSIIPVQNTRFYSCPSDTIRQRWITFSKPTFDLNKSFSVSHHRKIDYSDGIHRIRFVSIRIHRTPVYLIISTSNSCQQTSSFPMEKIYFPMEYIRV